MRVVYVSYLYWPPDFGGELLLSLERFYTLVQRGYEVTVLTAGRPGLPARDVDNGLCILRSPAIHDRWPRRLVRKLVFLLWALWKMRQLDFDVTHVDELPGIDKRTQLLSGQLIASVARRRGARTVMVHALADSEGEALNLRGLVGWLKRGFLRRMDHVVGISPSLFEAIRASFPNRAVLLPNGIRDELFVPRDEESRRQVREELGARDDDVVIVFLGQISHRKGFDLLARAFADLAPEHEKWRLWAVGPYTKEEGRFVDPEEAARVSLPLTENSRVTFLGRVDDRERLARIVGSGDFFVFPTRREGFGLAPVEAMAAGLPVIVAEIPGVTDHANIDGETGFYVPPGDLGELRKAMDRLGSDAELRRRMGAAARRRAVDAYGWNQHVARWARLYEGDPVQELDWGSPPRDPANAMRSSGNPVP